jgi:hypothetical protein
MGSVRAAAADDRFRVERFGGRLVAARVQRLARPEDVDAYAQAFVRLGEIAEPVLLADHRPVRIYTQPIADSLTELFKSLNRRWFRVAIVVSSTNATLAMQLQRIVRESVNPSRRVFFEADGALTFLGEVLTPAEVDSARGFLAPR